MGAWGIRGWGFMKNDVQRRPRAGRDTRGMEEAERPSHAMELPIVRTDTPGVPESVYPVQRKER